MENVQHTPGPWAVLNGTDIFPVDDYDGMNHVASADPNGDHPASFVSRTPAERRAELEADPASKSHIPYREAQANARLIAAAPELLEALKHCLSLIEGRGDFEARMACYNANAAVAKATSQTPDGAK